MSLEVGGKYTVTTQNLANSVHFKNKYFSGSVAGAGGKYTVTAQNLVDSVHFLI